MHEVKALIRPERLTAVIEALHGLPQMPGITMSMVHGFGRRSGGTPAQGTFGETTMAKVETVVSDDLLEQVVAAIRATAKTGRAGDGKIFVIPVATALMIRSADAGEEVL